MKATMSKDGRKRYSFKIEHRVGFHDFIYAVGEIIDFDMDIDLFENQVSLYEKKIKRYITRAKANKKLKELLKQKGENMWTVVEGWSQREATEDIAAEIVRKLYPELNE